MASTEYSRSRYIHTLAPWHSRHGHSAHLGIVLVLQASRGGGAAAVLLPRRVDEDHVELGAEGRQVEAAQVDLLEHRRRCARSNALVLGLDELLELRVLVEAVGEVGVADEVGRTLSRVHKVLREVVLRAVELHATAAAPSAAATLALAALAALATLITLAAALAVRPAAVALATLALTTVAADWAACALLRHALRHRALRHGGGNAPPHPKKGV